MPGFGARLLEFEVLHGKIAESLSSSAQINTRKVLGQNLYNKCSINILIFYLFWKYPIAATGRNISVVSVDKLNANGLGREACGQ